MVSVCYTAGALLTYLAFSDSFFFLFLPAGVTLSALVLTDRRQWPWILGAVAAMEILVDTVLVDESRRLPLLMACGLAVANVAEPLVGASLLRRFVPGRPDLLRMRQLVAFLLCSVLAGPLVGGLIGGTTLSLGISR